MRISDWSSDVCSSDLRALPCPFAHGDEVGCARRAVTQPVCAVDDEGMAGNVRRIRRAKENGRPGKFLQSADASRGHLLRPLVLAGPVALHMRGGIVIDRKSTRLNSSP